MAAAQDVQFAAATAAFRGQRGAILVHVAVVLVGLMAFSMFAIDYGVLWLSRGQAQNAADAGALSGAVSLAYVDPLDQDRARQAAAAMAAQNRVWGEPPEVNPATDVQFPPCPPGAPGLPDTCVRVDAYRGAVDRSGTGTRGTLLPTFFARLVGVNQQGVRATATAQVAVGNRVRCLKPWAVPDRWWEIDGGPPQRRATSDDTYDRYYTTGNDKGQLRTPEPRDVYLPPAGVTGTGVTPANLSGAEAALGPSGYDPVRRREDVGTQVTLKAGNPQQAIQPGWFFPIDLPLPNGPETGGDRYRENIARCNSMAVDIGDILVTEPGNMIGPTQQGVDELIARDPGAYWDNGIQNSAYANVSPRLVPIPVFSPEAYATAAVDPTTGRFQFQVVNILGFFIERMQGNDVTGRLMIYPGLTNSGSGGQTPSASFVRTVLLVR